MELQTIKQRPYRIDAKSGLYRCGIYGYGSPQIKVMAVNEEQAKREAAQQFKITPKAVWVKKLKKDK